MPAISSSAPGKIILCGEHAVVYGQPAIALPVYDVHTRCVILAKPNAETQQVIIKDHAFGLDTELGLLKPDHPIRKTIESVLAVLGVDHLPACEVQIHSTIPHSGGLGSSASIAVALTRATASFLGHPLEDIEVNKIAFEIEKLHHRTPSGIDNSVITYAKPVFYMKDTPIEILDLVHPMVLLIADSGIKGSTAKAVDLVRKRWKTSPIEFEGYFVEIGGITLKIKRLLQTGDNEEIGDLLTKNHKLLKEIGVSLPELDHLVDVAIRSGAYGAKLSGGGMGGNVIALVPPDLADPIRSNLLRSGAAHVLVARNSPTARS
jgi:mevalonate kinase